MLSGSRNIVRIVSRQHNGARLLAASQQHRTCQPAPGARLHTQQFINNTKVSPYTLHLTPYTLHLTPSNSLVLPCTQL